MTIHPQLDPTAALIIDLPILVKSMGEDSFGRRMIAVEASSEAVDGEGDVIEQAALLNAAESFIKNGHLDWNHYSELHARLGLKGSPSDWIIGNPREVVDLGDGRTGVVAELRRSIDGSFDPSTRLYDAIWRDLTQASPIVKYRASIYGFPLAGMIEDCRKATCSSAATRFHIKGLDWKSLALTTNPVNDSLTGFARVVTAKSFIELIKAQSGSPGYPPGWPNQAAPATEQSQADFKPQSCGPTPAASSAPMPKTEPEPSPASAPSVFALSAPRNLSDAVGQYHHHMKKSCAHTAGINSTMGFKNHFELCCGMDSDMADLYGHALMHHLLLEKRRT